LSPDDVNTGVLDDICKHNKSWRNRYRKTNC
jgi:hypothetical protein